MAHTPDAQTAEQRARALLDNRINSVRNMVTARQALDDLREQVAAAENDDVRAYRSALSDGWTAEELRKLGIDEPAKQARPRRRAQTRKDAGETAPEPTAANDV